MKKSKFTVTVEQDGGLHVVDGKTVRVITRDQVAAHRRDPAFDRKLRAALTPAQLAKLPK